MIIIDENVDQVLIDRLEKDNYEIISIREHQPGISDRKVMEDYYDKPGHFFITITKKKIRIRKI